MNEFNQKEAQETCHVPSDIHTKHTSPNKQVRLLILLLLVPKNVTLPMILIDRRGSQQLRGARFRGTILNNQRAYFLCSKLKPPEAHELIRWMIIFSDGMPQALRTCKTC
jgi:hypothetical protein